jgi:ABC-2 type transport system permease protein
VTTAELTRVPRGHYGFGNVARMEWIKLRTLRSTWVTLGISLAGALGVAIAVGLNTKSASEDITNNVLAGVALGLLTIGVLGVLVMTSEFSSGMIRATLAAAPNRSMVLAAKTAVFAVMALVVGELAAFVSFFAGVAVLRHGLHAPSLSDPGVLRAIVLSGAGYCLIGLLGLGLGTIIRHSPAAIAVLVGGVYVAAQLLGAVAHSVIPYLPISIVGDSLAAVKPVSDSLSAWAGLGMLGLYAVVALAVGGILLARRDA